MLAADSLDGTDFGIYDVVVIHLQRHGFLSKLCMAKFVQIALIFFTILIMKNGS